MMAGTNLILVILSVLAMAAGVGMMMLSGDATVGIILLVVGIALSGITATRSRK